MMGCLNMKEENHLSYKWHLRLPWPGTMSVSVFEETETDYITHKPNIPFLILKHLQWLLSGKYQLWTIWILNPEKLWTVEH